MCFKIILVTYFCFLPAMIYSHKDHFRMKRNLNPNALTFHSNQEHKVNFWLLTRINEDPIKSQVTDKKLFGGSYDSQRSTILLMTGYHNTPAKYPFVNETATDYLAAFDGMVIAVFWDASQGNYTETRAPVRDVALVLAQFLMRMASEESLDLESLTVAGFGMGAHIAGIAGRLLKGQIFTMIGLDPLNPLFIPGSSEVIDRHSARFVQVIHTSISAEGITEPLGHVDFYPNGGLPPQPGCGSLPGYTWTVCSHNRSWAFYSETFKNPSAFLGHQCSSYAKFKDGHCEGNPKAHMGYGISRSARGVFYLQTSSSPPFGLGDSNVCGPDVGKPALTGSPGIKWFDKLKPFFWNRPRSELAYVPDQPKEKPKPRGGKRRKGRNAHSDAESINSSEENRVHFHLITRETMDSPIISNISDSRLFDGAYDPLKPTALLIPGYLMTPGNASFVDTMVEAHLSVIDISLIAIFWDVALDDYRVSSAKTFDVAVVVAQFVDRMVNEESLNLGSLTLIGHSSGAQIGGTAGRLIKGAIANMIGLDPARPLFMTGAANVIDRRSGDFVQIIHTSGTVLGIFEPLGHVDFYVNSGLPPQPGCESVDFILPITPFSSTCSHLMRVVDLYAESVGNPCAFPATQCHSHKKYMSGGCDHNQIAFLGYETSRSARGTFHLQTRASSPYGLGTAC